MRGWILGFIAVLVLGLFPVHKAPAVEACIEPAWSSSAVYGGEYRILQRPCLESEMVDTGRGAWNDGSVGCMGGP